MKFLKRIITILVIAIILLAINAKIVKASLQSNPNIQYKEDLPENWIRSFRKMEIEGETMGLSEVLNEDLTPLGESNNIDVHMIKTTEYGATAILSASAYGNPSNEYLITTTTGNDTGVIIDVSKWEWTAGGLDNYVFLGVNGRYYDKYENDTFITRVGDALGDIYTNNPGCAIWHGTRNRGWVGSSKKYFQRGGTGIFSYYGNSSTVQYCRGVVVCGNGV